MRTRSQQLSPGGFLSLDTERAPRRTRSTRSTSQQPSESQSATRSTRSTSQQPESSQPAEQQTTTRAKPGRSTKKAAPKKAPQTTTSKRKRSTRTTKSTSSKAEQQTSAEHESQHNETEKPAETTPESTQVPDPDTQEDASEVVESAGSGSAPLGEPTSSGRESSPQWSHPSPHRSHPSHPSHPSPPQNRSPVFGSLAGTIGTPWQEFFTDPEPEPIGLLDSPHSPLSPWSRLSPGLPPISSPGSPIPLGSPLSPGAKCLDFDLDALFGGPDPDLDDLLAAGIAEMLSLHGRRESAAGGSEIPATEVAGKESLVSDSPRPAPARVEQPDVANGVESAVEQESALNTSEPPVVAEPTIEEPEESVAAVPEVIHAPVSPPSTAEPAAPTLTTSMGSGEEQIEADEQVHDLAESLAKLSLVSLEDSLPSSVPQSAPSTESSAAPACRPETVQEPASVPNSPVARQTLQALTPVSGDSVDATWFASILEGERPVCHTPILDAHCNWMAEPGQASYYLGRSIVEGPLVSAALAGEPELTPGPPLRPTAARRRTPVRRSAPKRALAELSPVPEEPEMSHRAGSSVWAEREGPERPSGFLLAASKAAMVPAEVRSHGPRHPPNLGASHPPSKEADKTKKTKKHRKKATLTREKVNRKRPHIETSDDDRSAPETPAANKRRNLGPPGSTPHTRRLTPLSRRLTTNAAPYSERLLRRKVEREGRIHKTLFRVPQLIAQREADRRAAEMLPLSRFPEVSQASVEYQAEQLESDSQHPENEPAAPEPPATPERQQGWNIRGLLSSVPRTFSRFIPGLGRSPERQEPVPPQPSSERIVRTQPLESVPAAPTPEVYSRRGLSEQSTSEDRPAKRPRNLSYSLFPAPMDKSLYLGDIRKSPKTTPAPPQPEGQATEGQPTKTSVAQESSPKESSPKESVSKESVPQESTTPRHQDLARSTQKVDETTKKKRKRSPSPDVIPNPKGCSYGMDMDYFCYSSDSEDETNSTSEPTVPQTEPRQLGRLSKGIVRNAISSEHHSSKKVRFDASPEDTPSKLRSRARATDPYHGKQFIGMSGASASPEMSPTPASHVNTIHDPQQRPGFIPNLQGTFQLDYDAFSDDSDSSGPDSPMSLPAPSPLSAGPSPMKASGQPESVQSPARQASRPTPASPSTPAAPSTPAKVDEEALARVRSQAEKYKPKTPSGLRTTSRYSSPLTAPSPLTASTPSTLGNREEAVTDAFGGDDDFARDAQWLLNNCPSGDLRNLVWPQSQSLVDSIGAQPESLNVLSSIWDDSEIDGAYLVFNSCLKAFEESKARNNS
ncbi:hypothetical protein BDW42DRAFT_190543 [Aspergillus taichungensis]|uniref:Uncharacterized protein n=1 Tax=Aspergillus taichungensis TaxID=482145 RepID=A0A2J5I711_9EURO|nr:hypothetical protein BDW42DRAFT_190543 [Aspergillus taichungensis]